MATANLRELKVEDALLYLDQVRPPPAARPPREPPNRRLMSQRR